MDNRQRLYFPPRAMECGGMDAALNCGVTHIQSDVERPRSKLRLLLANLGQQARHVETLACRVVIEQLLRPRIAIGDKLPRPLRAVELSVRRDDEPLLARIQTVKLAALLASLRVPEPRGAVA